MKRFLGMLMCAAMLITMVPATAFAEDATSASVSTEEELLSALGSGATDITVTANIVIKNQLNITAEAGSTITFKGNGNAVLDFSQATNDYFIKNNPGHNLVFEGLTIKVNNNDYKGFKHCASETYKNCTIEGCYWLYGNAEFTGCTFNQTSSTYNVWTYGAKEATFKNCIFNAAGKSVLVYKETGSETFKANFESCKFNTTAAGQTWDGQHVAAIEIDASLNPYDVTVVHCEANVGDNGFSGLARIKKGEDNCTLSVLDHNYVNGACSICGTEKKVTVTKPSVPSIDTSKPVTEVQVGADAATGTVLESTTTGIIDTIKAGESVTNIKNPDVVEAIKEALNSDLDITIDKKVVAKVLSKDKVDETDSALIVQKADGQIAQYLDLKVIMTVSVEGKEPVSSEITKLPGEVTFTIAIPEELKNVVNGYEREYFIIRVHDGVATEIPVTVNADGTLSFKTDCFSTYALGYKDTEIKNTDNPSGNNNGNASTNNSGSTSGKGNSSNNAGKVRTGDSTNVAGLMAVLVLSFGVCVLALRKRVVK